YYDCGGIGLSASIADPRTLETRGSRGCDPIFQLFVKESVINDARDPFDGSEISSFRIREILPLLCEQVGAIAASCLHLRARNSPMHLSAQPVMHLRMRLCEGFM